MRLSIFINKSIIAILFHAFFLHDLQAQNVHAFLFCKTSDKTIGTSANINYANMRQQILIIADALNYNYVEHSATGPLFTVKKIDELVEQASIGKDDVVFIYYSTHGVKSIYDSNLFPQLDIPNDLVSAYKKHNLFLEKKPKFLMTIIEACSGYQNITPQQAFVFEQSNSLQLPDSEDPSNKSNNIKKLFSSKCNIIIAAGNPGKNTWATNQGSMFTNCFLRSISEYIALPASKSQMVTWDNLLKQAKQYTSNLTRTTRIHYYPVWEKSEYNTLSEQSIVDSTEAKNYNIVFNLKSVRTKRRKNPFDISLSVVSNLNSDLKINKVVYYLHETMENPVVAVDNDESNFFLSLAVWGAFPIKAKVFLSNGESIDLYKNIVLSRPKL